MHCVQEIVHEKNCWPAPPRLAYAGRCHWLRIGVSPPRPFSLKGGSSLGEVCSNWIHCKWVPLSEIAVWAKAMGYADAVYSSGPKKPET